MPLPSGFLHALLVCLLSSLLSSTASAQMEASCRTLTMTVRRVGGETASPLRDAALIWHARLNRKAGHAPRIEPAATRVHQLTIRREAILPKVSVLRAGQTLEVVSTDSAPHNISISYFRNLARGFRPRLERPLVYQRVVDLSEPVPLPIRCSLHDDEQAWLIVVDHPFVGIADTEGKLAVRGLPPGKHWFRLWHPDPAIRSAELTVNGKRADHDRGRLELELRKDSEHFEVHVMFDSAGGKVHRERE